MSNSKIIYGLYLFAFWVFLNQHVLASPDDTGSVKIDIVEQNSILANLDSLTNDLYDSNLWLTDDTLKYNSFGYAPDSVPEYNDSMIRARIALIPSEINLDFNQYVRNYIDVYAVKRKDHVRRIMGYADLYFPMIGQKLDESGMPHELKYLAIVESALRAGAVSRAGATGLWQIMYPTGKMLGLRIDSYVDERRDPTRATDAALKYFQKLHKIYGDWLLVIAAYNCGPGNVNKAIRRSGGKRTFWEIRNYLPRETRGYVPAFLGATYVFSNTEEHNLRPVASKYSYNAVDTFCIHDRVDLRILAGLTGIPLDYIQFINPSIKKNIVPASKSGITLYIPMDKSGIYDQWQQVIIDSSKNELKVYASTSTVRSYSASSSDYRTSSDKFNKLLYKVKAGDNLGYIAEWFDCRAQDIRNWNGIYGNIIRTGQKLAVYVPTDKIDKYNSIAESGGLITKNISSSSESIPSSVKKECPNCVIHIVKNGETLWSITKLYPGSTVDKIRNANKVYNDRSIKTGTRLLIEN